MPNTAHSSASIDVTRRAASTLALHRHDAPGGNSRYGRYSDLALAGLVVAVIVMMAMPLPPWSLDILVAINMCAGVTLLLIALFVPTPLAFSTFPSVLLITTLFRISLNVATTRQILLHADGGEIIDTFGRMVVGGSLVVGLVIFLIITVVQFIVVAKGAERVAEVGARFTLDALPGKQMSIDADLRAGVISQTEAFNRRRDLVLESQFYGSMDGAMKFVKGDAVAGIVIVTVNLLGGIAIGALSLGMSLADAIQQFSVLSIGDGLVTQIPSLFVSIAAGIAITRTAPEGTGSVETANHTAAHLGDQIGRQLGTQPRAMMLSAGVMVLFSLVPGFPTLTFLGLATLTAWLGMSLTRRQRDRDRLQTALEVPAATREGESAPMMLPWIDATGSNGDRAIHLSGLRAAHRATQHATHHPAGRPSDRPPSAFRLELASTLIERFGAAALNDALAAERGRLRDDYGIPFPGLVLRADASLPADTFRILVQDLAELTLTLPESAVLVIGAMDDATRADIERRSRFLDAPAPEWLLPAAWIASEHADASSADEPARLEFLRPEQVLARLVIHTIQRHPTAALGVQEVRQLIKEIEWRYGDLTREALAILPLGRLADLMAALARERVPLFDFPGLLQAVVTHGPGAADTHTLYEAIRLSLARSIVAHLLPRTDRGTALNGGPKFGLIRLDSDFEALLRTALVVRADGPVLALSPAAFEAAAKTLTEAFQQGAPSQGRAIALPADLRRAVSRAFRTAIPQAAFLSYEELSAASVGG